MSDGWKQEKSEHRLDWVEILGKNLSPDDEPLLAAMLSDRSQGVRTAAARLLWRIPTSALARRMLDRVNPLVSFDPGAGQTGALEVGLPPGEFDPAWDKDGIVKASPHGMGPRQWWLAQMLSAVTPDHWARRFEIPPEALCGRAVTSDLANVLLDGFISAALRFEAATWFAPLWDAVLASHAVCKLVDDPLAALAARLSPEEAEPRMVLLLEGERLELLDRFPRPWPRRVARGFLQKLTVYRPTWAALLAGAAMAIPVDMLPAALPLPEVPDGDYAAAHYLRALDRFQSVANTRRAIAQETAP